MLVFFSAFGSVFIGLGRIDGRALVLVVSRSVTPQLPLVFLFFTLDSSE